MRFNRNLDNYHDYIKEIRKENILQGEYYKKMGMTRYRIKRLERKLAITTLDKQRKGIIKDINKCYNIINEYNKEVEHSRDRQHYFEQKVCNHDFGLILSEYSDEGITYQSGICLECDAEINGIERELFEHSVEKEENTKVEEYKTRLDLLKRKYKYSSCNYDYDIGEKIVKEMNNKVKSHKKSRY